MTLFAVDYSNGQVLVNARRIRLICSKIVPVVAYWTEILKTCIQQLITMKSKHEESVCVFS